MKNNNYFKSFKSSIYFLLLFFISVDISLAEGVSRTFKDFTNTLTENVITSAITLLMAAAFLFFFYGVVIFIYGRVTNQGDLSDLKKGKEFMLWGLIALFVMVSAWGIIKLAQGLLGVNGDQIQIKPVSFNQIQSQTQQQIILDSDDTSEPADPADFDNPYKDITQYPIINIGAKSDLPAIASSDGKAFTLLASLLKEKKCMETNISGFGTTYDETDSTYVKKFQSTNNLTSDGIVGQKTWEILKTKTGEKSVYSGITVKDCVKANGGSGTW